MTSPLPGQLWHSIEGNRRRDFLVSPDLTLSYGALAEGVRCWMAMFDVAGLAAGDRFVIRTEREDVAIAGFIAGLVDGIVPVLLEGSCPDPRLASIISTVEPGLVISDGSLPEMPDATTGRVLNASGQRTGLRGLLGRRGVGASLGEKAATRDPRLPTDDGLAYLMFTSGTTSAPSGVEISRSSLAGNLVTLSRLADCSTESRIFNDMVLAHADGLVQGPLLAAWNGAALLRAGGFEVQRIEEWLSCIRRFRATHVLTVPTVWSMIDKYAVHDDYFDAPECRMLLTVAAKIPEELWRQIETRFRRPLFSHYGLTETVTSALYAGGHPEMGARYTLGRPIDCEARIAGGAREGELELRGENVFSGYWGNPERTRASFTDDGWFRTGDLARQHEDGSFEMLGRLKLVIMSGGTLIRPEEIDEAMLRHPAVDESATVAMPDDIFGEIGVTGVVLSHDVAEAVLVEHLGRHVEQRKIPKRIVVLDRIPRGLSGKVRLDALRERLTDVADGDRIKGSVDDVASTVLEIAAQVFRVSADSLSLRTRPADVDGWDSFTQLNLVLSIEDHFQRRIPAARVSALRQLDDFVTAIRNAE